MAKVKVTSSSGNHNPMRPALTPESQENQMIALAMNLVQQRLLDGTASSQETTHFLKLATVKYQLEKEKLMKENRLIDAKVESLDADRKHTETYEAAIVAITRYKGLGESDDY